MSDQEQSLPSTRPYLIRALFDWCIDSGFTPFLAVQVGPGVRVPMEFVRDGQITLNIGADATQGLQIGNEWVEFKARFGGVARELFVPIDHVLAIYARENGQGMAFPAPEALADGAEAAEPDSAPALRLAPVPEAAESSHNPPPDEPPPSPRPALKRVK